MKTVRDQVEEDIATGHVRVIYESAPAPCVICGRVGALRYGCCLPCARVTPWNDSRVTKGTRVGGATS